MERIVEAHQATPGGESPGPRVPRPRNYDEVAGLVAEKVAKTRNVRHFQPLGVHTIIPWKA